MTRRIALPWPPGALFYSAANTHATLLFSPGMKQVAAAYDPLGRALAQVGISSLILSHDDDDEGGFPSIWRRRADDWKAGAESLAEQGIAFGIAGHSLGALCALAAGGARMDAALGLFPTFPGSPIVALAPPALLGNVFARGAFAPIVDPILIQIGRADVLAPVCARWQDRAQAWREASGARALLITAGANHYLGGLTGGTVDGRGDVVALGDLVAATRHVLLPGDGAPTLSRRSRFLSTLPLTHGNRP